MYRNSPFMEHLIDTAVLIRRPPSTLIKIYSFHAAILPKSLVSTVLIVPDNGRCQVHHTDLDERLDVQLSSSDEDFGGCQKNLLSTSFPADTTSSSSTSESLGTMATHEC